MLAGPDKFSRQSKYFLARGTVGKRREQRNPKRKSQENSEVTSSTVCNCNSSLPAKLPLLLSSPPRRAGQRAPDSRGYHRSPSPCLLQCSLPAPPPSVPLPRVHPRSPASHHLRNPRNPLPPKRTTSAHPWSSLGPLRWSGDPYGRGLISSSAGWRVCCPAVLRIRGSVEETIAIAT